MTERFLVDTSVWIEALRPGGQPEIAAWLREALLREVVVLAPPVKAEILIGARDEKQFAELAEMLGALPLLEERHEIWDQVASLGFRLRRQGLVVPVADLLIASWALNYACVLAHRDRHFVLVAEKVPGLVTVSFLNG
ncbi:MAG: PIN domain nuclease [Firmicutes bacterium]|nr:PIN domain nuclease [Bacillota bacterium]